MITISIFRKAINPQPIRELTSFLYEEIIFQRKASALPCPVGVMTICETELSLQEVQSKLSQNFPNLKFDVNLLGQTEEQAQAPEVCRLSLEELLDLVSANGIESLTQVQRTRLDELSGNA